MTYDLAERGQWSSQPIELYRFTRGLTTWLYTGADDDVTIGADVYLAVVLRRGDLPQNEERDNATLDVFMDPSIAAVAEFIGGATAAPTNVIVLRRQRLEAGVDEQAVIFVGQVGVVEFGEAEAHLTCIPMQKALQRKVPRWVFQTLCNHMLYDAYCGVDPGAYTIAGTITAVVGRRLTITGADAKPDGWANAGWVKDGDAYAFVVGHAGTTIDLLAITPRFMVGDAVTITAGCDRSQATCVAKFSNLENFMGFPYIPDKNPYEGLK